MGEHVLDCFSWSAAQEFSVWTRYDLPAHERRWNSVTEERAVPDSAGWSERSLGHSVRVVPRYKDGFYIASTELSAAVGIAHDPTALMELTGEGRTVTMLHHLYENTPNSTGWLGFEVSYRLGGELKRKKLSAFNRIELKRVRQTAVLVTEISDWDLELVLVDFVPKNPEGNVFLRNISVRTPTCLPLRDVKLHATLHNDGSDWKVTAAGRNALAVKPSGQMGISGRGALAVEASAREISLRLAPGPADAFHGALGLTAAGSPACLAAFNAQARTVLADVPGALERTLRGWRDWHALAPIHVENPRAQDFIDGALTLLKCLEASDAIRLGTMIYDARSVFVRDNWWIARALLASGRVAEAQKSQRFFYKTAARVGVCCAYRANGPQPPATSAEERGVELPAALVLMWKDLAPRIGARPASEYPLIKRILSTCELTPDSRQVFNTDEGWVWPLDYPSLGLVTENSVLLIEALEYAVEVAREAGDEAQAQAYTAQARRCREAIRERHFDTQRGYYWYGLDRDNFPFTALSTTLASALANHGFGSPAQPRIYSSLLAAWKYCRREGLLTATTASPIIPGFTSGQYLHAIADLNLPFAGKVLEGLWRQCSATGNLWEGYDLHDYSWSGERQRGWDTAVGLLGLLKQVFGITVDGAGITFHPHLLASVGPAAIRNFKVGKDVYDVEVKPDAFVIHKNGQILLSAEGPLRARFTAGTVELTPQFPQFPVREFAPLVIRASEGTVTAAVWPGPLHVSLPQLKLTLEADGGRLKLQGTGWRLKGAQTASAPGLDFVMADADFAPADTLEAGTAFQVCGYAVDRRGEAGRRVAVTWEGQRQEVACDAQGWFSAQCLARQTGLGALTVSTAFGTKTKTVRTGWNLSNHADEILGYSVPNLLIEKTTGGHDQVVATALLLHKGFPLPLVERAPEGHNVIRFARSLPSPALYAGDNYVVLKRDDRFEFVLRKGAHAWRDTLGFLTDMKLWTAPLQARAVNRYFSVMEVAERFGVPVDASPRQAITLMVKADRPMRMDVQGHVRVASQWQTSVDPAKFQSAPIHGRGDYVSVRIRPARRRPDSIHNALFGLEYECGARQPAQVELAFTFPVGCWASVAMWGKLWERTLDEAGIEHNADGSLTLRHVLHPGRPAYAKLIAADFPVRETFPLEKRNVTFEFAFL